MNASIVTQCGIRYPDANEFFSPSEGFPEYPFDTIAKVENPIYRLVRQVLLDANLDQHRFGSPSWNPLKKYIDPDSRVFILCNFVYHRRSKETPHSFLAKCIHGSVLRALIDYVLIATGPGGKVIFGNAPLQSCRWSNVLADTGADRVAEFYAAEGASVQAEDLRLFISERNFLGKMQKNYSRDAKLNAVIFDMAERSLLAKKNGMISPFRVMDYNPDRTDRYHSDNAHIYVINKSVLDAQTVISLPKLKVHEKVGLTCSLKGLVGTVGHKDCLAHHRFGSPFIGGDEFPSRHSFTTPLSGFHDWLHRREPGAPLQNSMEILHYLLNYMLRQLGIIRGGAWHGNDTAWRMVLDLAQIMQYGDNTGMLNNHVQRKHLALIDGIIGGEGNGPLAPRPVDSGTLIFSDDLVFADRIAWRLMGYRPEALPLLQRSNVQLQQCSLIDGEMKISYNGASVIEEKLTPVLSRPFSVPKGWHSYLSKWIL